MLMGGEELLDHAEEPLGVKAGGTTADGLFTLEDVECIAACTEAPCLQVNYRYCHKITTEQFDGWSTTSGPGGWPTRCPPHGVAGPRRASTSRPTGRPASPCPAASVEPAWRRTGPASRRAGAPA